MIDLTSRPRKRYEIQRCYYCPDHPAGKPIMPDDKNAQRLPDGSMKCGTCVISENSKMLSLFGGKRKKWLK
jgi:hypothetical protein